MASPDRIQAVVPAAGAGERLGGPKALALLAGDPFLAWVLAALRAAGLQEILVVLPTLPPPRLLRPYLQGVRVAANPEPAAGPIGSIRAGLRAAPPDAAGLLVHPVDHPLVRPETVRALCAGFPGPEEAVRVPVYQGRRGHPVLFGREVFAALEAVPPGEGARWVVKRAAVRVRVVPVPDPGVLLNVDTPADLARAEARVKSGGLPPPRR